MTLWSVLMEAVMDPNVGAGCLGTDQLHPGANTKEGRHGDRRSPAGWPMEGVSRTGQEEVRGPWAMATRKRRVGEDWVAGNRGSEQLQRMAAEERKGSGGKLIKR